MEQNKGSARLMLFRMVNDRIVSIREGFKNRTAEHASVGRGMLTFACGMGVITEGEMLDGIQALESAADARQMSGIRGYSDDKYAIEASRAFAEFLAHFEVAK